MEQQIYNNRLESKEGQEDGFFCSELVAAAYQKLGLLEEGRSATSFWPSTLAREDLRLE